MLTESNLFRVRDCALAVKVLSCSNRQDAKAWPHLEHLAKHIAPQKDCVIGLLIGYNSPQALMPREVVCGEENQSFAQKTDLGWRIVSYCHPSEHCSDAIGVSHRIIVRQVTPEPIPTVRLKGKVRKFGRLRSGKSMGCRL